MKIIENMRQNLISRILSSWFLSCSLFVVFGHGSPVSPEFAAGIDLVHLVLAVLFFFVVLGLAAILTEGKSDMPALVASAFVYAVTLTLGGADEYFLAAVVAAVAICVAFAAKNGLFLRDRGISRTVSGISVGVLCAIVFAFVCAVGIFRYLTYSTPCYDFGIFSNMFYNMKKTGLPITTCERDGALSHFAVHFSPIFYLILPFYMIFPSPITLDVAAAAITSLSVVAMYLLCRARGLKQKHCVAFCAILAFYPALSGGNMFDIHENVFLTPFLLFMFWAYEKKKYPVMYVFAVLTLLIKEDAAIYIAFFALYLMADRREFRHGAILFFSSVAYFAGVSALMSRYGEGLMTVRYDGLVAEGQTGLFAIVANLVKSPSLAFGTLNSDMIPFLLLMFVPLGTLFVIVKRPARLLLLCPMMLINIMSSWEYQHSIYFQYVSGTLAFLFYAALLCADDIDYKTLRGVLLGSVCASIVMFSGTTLQYLGTAKTYVQYREMYRETDRALSVIPDDASVSASTLLIAKLSSRFEIYPLDSAHETEYIALDLMHPEIEFTGARYAALGESPDYEEVCTSGGVAIFRKINFGK